MRRLEPYLELLPWLFLVAVWVLSFVYPATPLEGKVLCVWRKMFDVSCPGCGLTRSFIALSAGSLSQSLDHHLAGPGLYAAMVWCVVVWAFRMCLGRSDFLSLPKRALLAFWVVNGLLFVMQAARVVMSWVQQ